MDRRGWGLVTLLLVGFGLASCAGPSGPPRVVVESDAFSKDVTISGVQVLDNQLLDLDKAHWYLRSFVDPQSQKVQHQLYAELTYPGDRNGRYFAADDHAQPYRVDRIYDAKCERFFKGDICTREDTIGIDISEATLRANAASGLAIKITASSGYSRILTITPEMIAAQLYATREVLSGQVVVGRTVQSGGTIAAGPPAGGDTAAMPAGVAANATAAPTPGGKPLLGIAPLDLPFGAGVMVSRVDPNTPAAAAGFQIGDMVVRYNGQPVTGADQLRNLIAATAPGSRVPIDITRHGTPMTLPAQL